jgi:hypothetical protein
LCPVSLCFLFWLSLSLSLSLSLTLALALALARALSLSLSLSCARARSLSSGSSFCAFPCLSRDAWVPLRHAYTCSHVRGQSYTQMINIALSISRLCWSWPRALQCLRASTGTCGRFTAHAGGFLPAYVCTCACVPIPMFYFILPAYPDLFSNPTTF